MSDILSQSEIDNLLKQLSEGDLDVDQIQGEDEKQVKTMTSAALPNSPKNIYEPWRSYSSITAD